MIVFSLHLEKLSHRLPLERQLPGAGEGARFLLFRFVLQLVGCLRHLSFLQMRNCSNIEPYEPRALGGEPKPSWAPHAGQGGIPIRALSSWLAAQTDYLSASPPLQSCAHCRRRWSWTRPRRTAPSDHARGGGGSHACSSRRRKSTSWSGASSNSGTCPRPSATSWPAC